MSWRQLPRGGRLSKKGEKKSGRMEWLRDRAKGIWQWYEYLKMQIWCFSFCYFSSCIASALIISVQHFLPLFSLYLPVFPSSLSPSLPFPSTPCPVEIVCSRGVGAGYHTDGKTPRQPASQSHTLTGTVATPPPLLQCHHLHLPPLPLQ